MRFAGGEGLVGGGEQAAFCVEGDSGWRVAVGGEDGFEVAEAGVGLFAGEFDARGEGHVGFVEVDLLVGDFDHLVLGHAGGEDGAECLVVEQGQGAAGGVASAACASAAGLDVLDVLPVVLGDGGSPGADGGEVGADLGIGFEAVGFVARDGEAW